MNATRKSRRARWPYLLATVLCLLMLVTPAFAGGSGGNVVPAGDEIKGYSLAEAAKATANFNDGARMELRLLPEDFRSRKIQMLYTSEDQPGEFSVEPGTALYVPVVYSDDTDLALWPFFPDVNDQAEVSAYYFDPKQLGAEYFTITVDGKATDLGPAYAAGAHFEDALAIGAHDYTVVAAFLTPLAPGTHTIAVNGLLSGEFIWNAFHTDYPISITYTVTVKGD